MRHKQVLSVALVLGLALIAATAHTEGNKTGVPETQITIDGGGEDWVGRPVLCVDPAGDAEAGFLDLTTGYAFVNQNALYLLIDTVDPRASFVQLDMFIKADAKTLLLSWQPGQPMGGLADITTGFEYIGPAMNSSFAFGPALEVRLDLQDLGSPERLNLHKVLVMVGECCQRPAWRPADEWRPITPTPVVDEIDAALAQHAQRTERPGHVIMAAGDVKAGYLYRSFLQAPWDLAWGPDDCLYVVDMHGRHVVRLAPDGTMDDPGIWRNPGLWVSSPTALAFDSAGNLYVSDNPVIYAVSADGKVNKLPDIQGGPIAGLAFSRNDELYYTDMAGGQVLRVGLNGRSHVVARGIPGAQDLAFSHDGALYVSQIGPNSQIVKVDVKTGAVTPFFTDEMFIGDPLFLAVDQEGDLWAATVNTLFQLSPDGTPKPFRVDGRTYSGNVFELDVETAGGIAFDDKSRLWIASFTSTIWRLDPPEDPSQGMTLNLIVPGFCASDLEIGPDGGVYAYNVNPHPGELWRISHDGEVEVLHQFDHHGSAAYEKIVGLAKDNKGNLYIGLIDGEIKRLGTNGRLTRYAWLPSRAQRMTFGADGYLYAAVGGPDEPKSIVRIVGMDNYSTLINRIDGKPLGPKGVVHVDAAPGGGLYLFDEYYSKLYYVDFDGQASVVADLPGTGSPATMAVSPEGDIFLILHHALDPYPDEYSYSVLRIDPRGNIEIYAEAIMGDPLGAVVSSDGRWLYISENGAIDKIPLIGSD